MEVGQTGPSANPRRATGGDPQGWQERESGRKTLVNTDERIDSALSSRNRRQRRRRVSHPEASNRDGTSSPPADDAGKEPDRKERQGEEKERESTDRTSAKARDNGPERDAGSTGWAASPCRGGATREGGIWETSLSVRREPRRGTQAHGRRGCKRSQPPRAQRTSTKNKTLERTAPPMKV